MYLCQVLQTCTIFDRHTQTPEQILTHKIAA